MNHWKEALQTLCDLYFQSGRSIDWIVVGSASSVLQGAVMQPNDLDIYTRHQTGVEQFASLLEPFQLRERCDLPHHDANWLSSKEDPYYTQTFASGFTWIKGRWKLNSFPVEVVHISDPAGIPDSDQGEGIWEGGKYIWDQARYAAFHGYRIPLVPLEIQLESNLRRKRQDRVEAILDALRTRGFDAALLQKAVSKANYDTIRGVI